MPLRVQSVEQVWHRSGSQHRRAAQEQPCGRRRQILRRQAHTLTVCQACRLQLAELYLGVSKLPEGQGSSGAGRCWGRKGYARESRAKDHKGVGWHVWDAREPCMSQRHTVKPLGSFPLVKQPGDSANLKERTDSCAIYTPVTNASCFTAVLSTQSAWFGRAQTRLVSGQEGTTLDIKSCAKSRFYFQEFFHAKNPRYSLIPWKHN
ncbi:uncharacterized protein PV09_04153 [Verruconis gallopava]|uniref:Uncharacterized protein n=1 Tax=Verruconis gallopava TaxID=253628 RepID=A0A0D2B0Z6_9PEZI|nr:uncharacterized protein PV09_04153 [Verruconis gallopava]KIW04994.1 hypothetical protein PV09_04153 [Verruconis gallopava]